MKRNFIKLIKEMKDDKPVFNTYLTPSFISFRKMYEAADVQDEVQDADQENERKAMDEMLDMVVSIYDNQFTRDQLIDGLHSPDAIRTLNEQIDWVAQGRMNEDAKKELAKMV
ncbi:phage tail assembly chaperone G [Staphylococcus equorum]|uniref:Phage protein n=1 Tax=Staphylococcus equorum TaxID=246432 RepID=A0A9X4LD07_9STAP|nr:hypothetical protein [Staphylococcus equorum]MDG0860327.1 hypothetical protein [Staphylococcus equorum]